MRKMLSVLAVLFCVAWSGAAHAYTYNYFYGTDNTDSIKVGHCLLGGYYRYCACINGSWVDEHSVTGADDMVFVDTYDGADYVSTPAIPVNVNCGGASRNLYPFNDSFECPTITFSAGNSSGTIGEKTYQGGPCWEHLDCGYNVDRCWLYGNGGDDVLTGGSGNDVLIGGSGVDDIKGNDGNDVIYGGLGLDWLGGPGGDEDGWDCFVDQDVYYLNGGYGFDGQTDTDPLWPGIEIRVTSCPIPDP